MRYGWDVVRDLKLGRQVEPTDAGLLGGLGYGATYDAVQRMTGSSTGRGTLAGGATEGTPLGSWVGYLVSPSHLIVVGLGSFR